MSENKSLKSYIEELIQEVENELDETNVTGNVDGYQTPHAFSGKGDSNRRKKTATQLGYELVDNDVNNIDEAKTYKKGDKLKIKLPNGKKFDVVFVDYSRTKGVALGKFKDGSGEYDTKPFNLDTVVESVNEAAMNPVKKVVNAILKKYKVDAMKTTSTSVRGFHNIKNGGYKYEGDYFLQFYKVPQDTIVKIAAEMKKAGVKGVQVNMGNISADYTKTGLSNSQFEATINEDIEPQTKKIASLTGTRPDAVKQFVSSNALNITKLLKFVEKGKLSDRMDFVTALSGKPGNPIQKKMIKMFSESINENRWLELKNDDSMHANKKLAVGLKELKYQLAEVEKFFNWYNKIKNINELDSDNYWKRTNTHIYKIKERLINIARTLQEIEK